MPPFGARIGTVEWFNTDSARLENTRDALKRCPDIQRALSRLAIDRGGPRDLAAIRNALEQLPTLVADLKGAGPDLVDTWLADLEGFDDLSQTLDTALIAEPPLLARDGGFIAEGVDPELDEARKLRDEGRGVIAGMQSDYARDTGILSLKIKHNNVLGYFIETTATHAEKMLAPPPVRALHPPPDNCQCRPLYHGGSI